MTFKKKGISPVIATVLLLLLTVAAVSVIAAFVIPFVRENLQSSTECVPYRDYLKFDESFGFNCFDSKYNYAVSVKANAAQESVSQKVIGFDLLFVGESESKKVSVRNNQSACGGEVTILGNSCPGDSMLRTPESGEAITFVYSEGSQYNSVEVYPVLTSERVCDKTDSIKLTLCKGGTI